MGDRETVVSDPSWVRALIRVGFPLIGAGAGVGLLGWVLPWLVRLSWLPLPGVLRWIAGLPLPVTVTGGVLLGTGAGAALAVSAVRELLTVTVGTDRLVLARTSGETSWERRRISGVFRDGRQLVLLGPAGEELAREVSDLPEPALRQAFQRHGYRWHDGGDPYEERYRRWVPGIPELPAGADPLLQAREQALRRQDTEDAAQLRVELARLGVVVRDEGTRQFWRGTIDQ